MMKQYQWQGGRKQKKQYGDLQKYLNALQEQIEHNHKKIESVNHEIVDVILTDYRNKNEAEQIQWKIEGQIPDQVAISDIDLGTLFSNLLSNSIEACNKVEKKETYIHLEIRSLDSKIVIEMSNSVNEPVNFQKFGTHYTTKSDQKNHGYGMENIMDVVRRNDGEIFFENLEDGFLVRMIL